SGGVAMREQQAEAFKPAEPKRRAVVVYKGPFRSVTGDDGTVYARGERVAVIADQAEAQSRWPGGQFLVLWGPEGAVPGRAGKIIPYLSCRLFPGSASRPRRDASRRRP